MLAQLTISNFAIVRELEIDFHSGMTAITGETGAGKTTLIRLMLSLIHPTAGKMPDAIHNARRHEPWAQDTHGRLSLRRPLKSQRSVESSAK
mgnify:CR=1 FL=1